MLLRVVSGITPREALAPPAYHNESDRVLPPYNGKMASVGSQMPPYPVYTTQLGPGWLENAGCR
jgi:hypothetical protein